MHSHPLVIARNFHPHDHLKKSNEDMTSVEAVRVHDQKCFGRYGSTFLFRKLMNSRWRINAHFGFRARQGNPAGGS